MHAKYASLPISERARFIYLTYLALVTSLLTITSRNFITATVLSFYDNAGTINIKDTKQSANNAAAAGAIMLCITNYALIIFIGLGRCTDSIVFRPLSVEP